MHWLNVKYMSQITKGPINIIESNNFVMCGNLSESTFCVSILLVVTVALGLMPHQMVVDVVKSGLKQNI